MITYPHRHFAAIKNIEYLCPAGQYSLAADYQSCERIYMENYALPNTITYINLNQNVTAFVNFWNN